MRAVESQRRFSEASRNYLPDAIRLLFIAEAPPAYRVNRYFYFAALRDGDTLFLEMMKVLYPDETGYSRGSFLPGHSAKQLRQNKTSLLQRFQRDGYYLIDGCEEPMPDGADTATKRRVMKNALPALELKVRRLAGDSSLPIVLIGGITYEICAEALRKAGGNVLNTGMINHPARGGQVHFRSKLAKTLDRESKTAKFMSHLSRHGDSRSRRPRV